MAAYRDQHVDVVLDVRSRLEYWFGHLPGARNIPMDRLPQTMMDHPEITRESRILVYCASGTRSALAAQWFRTEGYKNVVDGGAIAAVRPQYRK